MDEINNLLKKVKENYNDDILNIKKKINSLIEFQTNEMERLENEISILKIENERLSKETKKVSNNDLWNQITELKNKLNEANARNKSFERASPGHWFDSLKRANNRF